MQCVKNVSRDRERGGDRITKLQRKKYIFISRQNSDIFLPLFFLCFTECKNEPASWHASPLPMVYQKGCLAIHKATADLNYLQIKMLDALMPFLPTRWNPAQIQGLEIWFFPPSAPSASSTSHLQTAPSGNLLRYLLT